MTGELRNEQLDQLHASELNDRDLEGVVGGKDGVLVGVGGRPGWGGYGGGFGGWGGGWGGGGWGGRPGWGGYGGGYGRRFW